MPARRNGPHAGTRRARTGAFFETRVSTDGKQSCGECHQPMYYGTDALPRSVGNQGKVLRATCPRVQHRAAVRAALRGNRVDVEEQALKPW